MGSGDPATICMTYPNVAASSGKKVDVIHQRLDRTVSFKVLKWEEVSLTLVQGNPILPALHLSLHIAQVSHVPQ